MQRDTERAVLRAVLFADLHQYGRLVAANEGDTVEFVTRSLELFRRQCQEFGGEFIKTTGDGALLLFDSASVAIDYAITLQARIRGTGNDIPPVGLFRIGLHMGEVLRRGTDVFGHTVNLAARVEAEAQPGGVCVTQEVYNAAHSSTRYSFRFGGRAVLKNIPEPVPIYHVTEPDKATKHGAVEYLRISVIDGLSLSTDRGQPLPVRSPAGRAILGYLALSKRSGEPLDRIAALIWPDRDLLRARRALAGCVASIEKAVGAALHEGLLRRGETLSLTPSRTVVDLLQLLADLHKGRVDELLLERSDWPETILLGFENVSSLFKAWLSVARHSWRERMSEALEADMERFEAKEPSLRHAATALLLLDPTHEPAAQKLIRHHVAVGNVSAAMRVYRNLREVMQERFSLAPSKDTEALISAISSSSSARVAGRAQPIRPARIPTVVVGQFQARTDILTHPVSGFRADLIANLSKFRELTIVEAPEEMGNFTGDYVLTAECLQIEPDARLFVRLVDSSAGRVIWSESFVLSLENWINAQQRLVGHIASELEVYLSQDRLSRALPGPDVSLNAYDAWLRGESLLARWSPADEDEAERLFKGVIAQDLRFAPAYASLASVYNSRHIIRPGSTSDPSEVRSASKLAQHAVELDPLDARNHLVSGWNAALLGRFDQSEVHFELAAQLNPNNPKTLFSAANGLAFMGRKGEATRLINLAMSLTPQILDYQWSYIATVKYLSGDQEGAIQAANLSKNRIIDTSGWRAAALNQLGRRDEARAAFTELCNLVSAAWEGPNRASPRDILSWFLAAFPMRHQEDKRGLMALEEFCD